MNFPQYHRIKAIVLRNLLRYKSNILTIIDIMYWPTLDIAIWGTTSTWISKNDSTLPTFALAIMTGIVFWEMTIRSIYEVSVTMLREIYSKSLLTLFTTPLTIAEWIIGVMVTSVIRAIISVLFCSVLVWILYLLNIFTIGWMFIPFAISLLIFGWSVGFLGASFIVYWGQKFEALPWMALWLFAPFSAIYYPVSALPKVMQYIATCIPTSYIFEGMRFIINTGKPAHAHLFMSLGLGTCYLIIAITFFVYMFKKSKQLGLSRL